MVVGQVITTKVGIFNMLSNLNFGFWIMAFFLASVTAAGLFCLLLSRLAVRNVRNFRRKSGLLSKLIYLVKNYRIQSERKLQIYSVSLGLFFWLSLCILANNIKTNKVVASTSDLVKSLDEVFDSPKVLCLNRQNTEVSMAMRSPKGAVLSRLFHEKTQFKENHQVEQKVIGGDRCFTGYDPSVSKLLSNVLLLVTEVSDGFLIDIVYY